MSILCIYNTKFALPYSLQIQVGSVEHLKCDGISYFDCAGGRGGPTIHFRRGPRISCYATGYQLNETRRINSADEINYIGLSHQKLHVTIRGFTCTRVQLSDSFAIPQTTNRNRKLN